MLSYEKKKTRVELQIINGIGRVTIDWGDFTNDLFSINTTLTKEEKSIKDQLKKANQAGMEKLVIKIDKLPNLPACYLRMVYEISEYAKNCGIDHRVTIIKQLDFDVAEITGFTDRGKVCRTMEEAEKELRQNQTKLLCYNLYLNI